MRSCKRYNASKFLRCFSNMKTVIMCLIGLIELMNSATAQETMQFTFIGTVGGNDESVVLTSAKDLKINDAEVLQMDQRTLDTLKIYILRNYLARRGNADFPKKGITDSVNAVSDIKVTGVDSIPLYFKKDTFTELVFSTMRHLEIVGLKTPTIHAALQHLRYLGHEEFYHSHLVDPHLELKNDSNK
jgi:hypothetical protein